MGKKGQFHLSRCRINARMEVYTRMCVFAIQLTDSVWDLKGKEPAGRSAVALAAVNLSFLLFLSSCLSVFVCKRRPSGDHTLS